MSLHANNRYQPDVDRIEKAGEQSYMDFIDSLMNNMPCCLNQTKVWVLGYLLNLLIAIDNFLIK